MSTNSHRTFSDAVIPYGAYWSTPFVRWQGSFANSHPIKLAADVAVKALAARGIDPALFTEVLLGTTVPSKSSFFGAPWYATLIGAPGIGGPMVAQACATSARVLAMAAADVEAGDSAVLGAVCDRTSNGPVVYYPNPSGPGGMGESEQWVWDNFNNDPTNGSGGIEMAERIAAEASIDKGQQDEIAVMRYEQYVAGEGGGAEFRGRYMVTPVEVMSANGKRVVATVSDDEGVTARTMEQLEGMRPVFPNGTVSGGTQTYAADGSCGMVVCNAEVAAQFGDGPVTKIVAFGQARARTGYLGESTVVSARAALDAARLTTSDLAVVKTHNPFAVHDGYFSQQLGVPLEAFNNHGSSLVYGHPNGATGMRMVMEMIEELVDVGGGYGMFSGCAAGDTGGAVIVKVGD